VVLVAGLRRGDATVPSPAWTPCIRTAGRANAATRWAWGSTARFPTWRGYTQLNRDTARAFGAGAQVGIPAFGWSNHQLYARYDLRLPDGRRVLLNPGVFLHVGNSPNGQDTGHFVELVQAVGLERRGERTTTIPALALVIGRGERESYGVREGPFTTAFGMLSISVTFHRPRSAAAQRSPEQ
jgi:hypothetical protein